VPSATEADAFYTVTGTAMDASDHSCDAIRLARMRAKTLRQAKRQPTAVVSLPGERTARASATFRIGGVAFTRPSRCSPRRYTPRCHRCTGRRSTTDYVSGVS